jgi:Tol biopolymer transport system component
MMKFLIFSIFLWIFPHPTFAAVDPSLSWQVSHSAHFDLIYDAQQQDLALLSLDRLEKAYAKLALLWTHLPERITVVLDDRTDLTNGAATALPYAHVLIFPVLPGPQESISEYGDWAEEIAIHELTHILSFEQRRGGVQFLSHIFGTIITPNLLLPRWWLEGVAVDAETRLSAHGRLRSNYQDATLRALATSDRWDGVGLAEINEQLIPTWPYGSRPYLYGSLLWSEMIAIKGRNMINELHEVFGGRFPYLLSGPIEDRFDGLDLPLLFEQTKRSTKAAVEKQKRILQQTPFTEFEKFLDEEFVETLTPRISPDGLKMAFLAKDDTLKRSIQVLIRPSTKESFSAAHRLKVFGQKEEIGSPPGVEVKLPRIQEDDAPPGGTINRLTWKPDSNSFIFDLVAEQNMFHDVSDLWIYSLETGKAEQLTKGLRAREPDLSPDGTRVAYVQMEAGRTSLAIYDLKSERAETVHKPDLLSRVSWPVWLDDRRVLFTVREKGRERFAILQLTDRKVETPSLSLREVALPFVKNKKVYFVSNESGVRNLYETDLNFRAVKPITHLWTGAYAGDLDEFRNELWLTQIGNRGFELGKRNLASEGPKNLPTVSPLFADRYPIPSEMPSAGKTPSETDDYSALGYLWPRFWIPFVNWDDKGTQISASTFGFDPLQKHAYSVFASYDSAIERGSYLLRYQNQVFQPTLIFQSSDLSSYLADPEQATRTQSNFVQSAWELAGIDPDLTFAVGWSWLAREQLGVKSTQTGPMVALAFQRIQQRGEQISPESGGAATFTSTQFLEGEGREHYNLSTLTLLKYGKMPWGRHHAWMARFAGQSIDRPVLIANLDSSLSTLAAAAPTTQFYLMRGYVTGAFLGKSIANLNLEYRFPLSRIDRGTDHFAFFLRRISGALVTDGIWLDGFVYDTTQEPFVYRRVDDWKGFASAGGEMKFEFTLGYHFEFQIVAGVYAPLSSEYAESAPRFGLGLAL